MCVCTLMFSDATVKPAPNSLKKDVILYVKKEVIQLDDV